MGTAELLDLAKGFGASAPIIALLLWLLISDRKTIQELRQEIREMQGDQMEMLKEQVALGVMLKSLLERIVTKVGA